MTPLTLRFILDRILRKYWTGTAALTAIAEIRLTL